MGKYYAQWRRPPRPERKWRVHPIWRGIGCLMLIIVPLISWAIADIFVKANKQGHWLDVPPGVSGPAGYPDLFVTAMVAVIVAIMIFGFYTVIYTLIYRMTGPPTYGPLDAPPIKRKVAKGRPRSR
jgi:hypothetical protein